MKSHVLDELFLLHGIFNDVAGRNQIVCTPASLVVEHFDLRFCSLARRVQMRECLLTKKGSEQ
jgi:hypothetical protein